SRRPSGFWSTKRYDEAGWPTPREYRGGGKSGSAMSDFAIPGVNDKYNTQKIIDALMEAKREPLKRMQKEVALEKQRKGSWLDVSHRLSTLRDSSRALYGFQNPFNDRIASSSDEKTLVASASRQALEETKQILVKK